MRAEGFFDTNILVYAASDEREKTKRATELLAQGGVVSVQVLNEFANVARRKLAMSWKETNVALRAFRLNCQVVVLTIEAHDAGLALASAHDFSIYDAMIIASAQLAGCKTLFSEDLQDGRKIGGVRIVNPFT